MAAGELGEGEVAEAGEAPGHRRRVAEHGVELEGGAEEHVDHEQPEDGTEGEEQRVEPAPPAEHRRRQRRRRRRTPSTKAQ